MQNAASKILGRAPTVSEIMGQLDDQEDDVSSTDDIASEGDCEAPPYGPTAADRQVSASLSVPLDIFVLNDQRLYIQYEPHQGVNRDVKIIDNGSTLQITSHRIVTDTHVNDLADRIEHDVAVLSETRKRMEEWSSVQTFKLVEPVIENQKIHHRNIDALICLSWPLQAAQAEFKTEGLTYSSMKRITELLEEEARKKARKE